METSYVGKTVYNRRLWSGPFLDPLLSGSLVHQAAPFSNCLGYMFVMVGLIYAND